MLIHIIIIVIIILLFLIVFTYFNTYNKFQDYIIKINEVENKINDALNNKYDIILKLNNNIKEKIKTKKNLVDDLSELKKDEIDDFKLDEILTEAMDKVNFVKENYSSLDDDKEVDELLIQIEDTDESLRACKKYYNETITSYNELFNKFPYNIVSKILKYEKKEEFKNNKNENKKEMEII